MHMGRILTAVMMFFFIAGAADEALLKGRLGLAAEFDKGFNSTGSLTMAMAGIMCIAPVAGKILTPLAAPVFLKIGADPAMLSGILFSVDMGGYPLAVAMTDNSQVQILSGVLLSAMMGSTVIFTIPVALSMCRDEDRRPVSKGVVLGIIAIPFGLITGALTAGLPGRMILTNSVPVIAIAAALAVILTVFPEPTLAGFKTFGDILKCICILSLTLASLEEALGITLLPGMDPLGEQLKIIGLIGVTLAGAYPFIRVLSRCMSPVLRRVGKILDISDASVAGILASLANPLPMFDLISEMDDRGKVVAMAFAVPALAVFGDHMGYVSAVCPDAVIPLAAGKLTAGIVGLILAEIFESAPLFPSKRKEIVKNRSRM